MMVAKGIGGGFPLGAVLATENAASGMVCGDMARPMAAIRWPARSARCDGDRRPKNSWPR